jgi:hypothetical protein
MRSGRRDSGTGHPAISINLLGTPVSSSIRRCDQGDGIVEHKGLVHKVGLGLVEVMYLQQPKLAHRFHPRVPSV